MQTPFFVLPDEPPEAGSSENRPIILLRTSLLKVVRSGRRSSLQTVGGGFDLVEELGISRLFVDDKGVSAVVPGK